MRTIQARIGEKIRQRRELLGWTQPKLAVLVGLTQGHLSRIERGEKKPSWESAEIIAQALNTTLGALLGVESNAEITSRHREVAVMEIDEVPGVDGARFSERLKEVTDLFAVGIETPISTIAVRLRGNSMTPAFQDGNIVVVNPEMRPVPGAFVLAEVEGEIVFRKYKERFREFGGGTVFDLVPLNESFATYRSDVQRIAIIGVGVTNSTNILPQT